MLCLDSTLEGCKLEFLKPFITNILPELQLVRNTLWRDLGRWFSMNDEATLPLRFGDVPDTDGTFGWDRGFNPPHMRHHPRMSHHRSCVNAELDHMETVSE